MNETRFLRRPRSGVGLRPRVCRFQNVKTTLSVRVLTACGATGVDISVKPTPLGCRSLTLLLCVQRIRRFNPSNGSPPKRVPA